MTVTKEQVGALKALEDRQGRLLPSAVVQEAADPKSPLHSWFTWDDELAAQKRRLDEARELIRTVRMEVIVEEIPFRVPGYLRDPMKAGDKEGYQAFPRVRAQNTRDVIVTELRQIVGLCSRLAGIVQAKNGDVPASLRREILKLDAQVAKLLEAAIGEGTKAHAAG